MTASPMLRPSCRTAVGTQTAIDVVYDEPGLQLLASATVAPAASNALASGRGPLVDRSHAGSNVATVSDVDASASTSDGRR